MTRQELAEIVERHILAEARWKVAAAEAREEAFGNVPSELLETHVLLNVKATDPELYDEYILATIAHEQAGAELALRRIEAEEQIALMRNPGSVSLS